MQEEASLKAMPIQKEEASLKAMPIQKEEASLKAMPIQKEEASLGVPPDLKSGVKKGSTTLFCGFKIRSKGVCFSFCWGISNPPVLRGRTFFNGGFQIRRNA